MKLRPLPAALTLIASTALAGAQSPPPQDFALVGASVVDPGGKTFSPGMIVVRSGKIASVGPAADPPDGLAVIRAEGSFAYPAFIEGSQTSGFTLPDEESEARPGVDISAPATMWIEGRKGFAPGFTPAEALDLKNLSYRSGIGTALLMSQRGGLRGWASLVELLSEGDDRVLAARWGAGISFRRAGGNGYPTNILGVIAQLRQNLYDAKLAAEGGDPMPGAPADAPWRAGLKALEPAMTGQAPAIFEANEAREIERALDMAEEFGLKPVILGGREAGKLAPRLAAMKAAVILTAELGREPDAAPAAGPDAVPAEVLAERRELWRDSAISDQKLSEAGIPFMLSARGSVRSLLDVARERIGRGLKPEAALQAMTSGAASILGRADLGRLQPGVRASIVLLSGPFDKSESEVQRVWISGRPVHAPQEESK
jgi:imidazolonepropionase-like amidohydrolase